MEDGLLVCGGLFYRRYVLEPCSPYYAYVQAFSELSTIKPQNIFGALGTNDRRFQC